MDEPSITNLFASGGAELKRNLTNAAFHYWYILCIVALLAVGVFQWQIKQSTEKELADLKAKVSITKDIDTLEHSLDAMKAREAEYVKVLANQDKLNKTLIDLDKKQQELNKRKKEVIRDEISKMGSHDLSNQFNLLGISNTLEGK